MATTMPALVLILIGVFDLPLEVVVLVLLGEVRALEICGHFRHPDWLLYVLVGFIAAFAFSQGAVIWVYISEIFPNPTRARGQDLGSSTHWLANALIAGVFPTIAASRLGAPFVVLAAMKVLQLILVTPFYQQT